MKSPVRTCHLPPEASEGTKGQCLSNSGNPRGRGCTWSSWQAVGLSVGSTTCNWVGQRCTFPEEQVGPHTQNIGLGYLKSAQEVPARVRRDWRHHPSPGAKEGSAREQSERMDRLTWPTAPDRPLVYGLSRNHEIPQNPPDPGQAAYARSPQCQLHGTPPDSPLLLLSLLGQ